jgi:hypothetical protein
MQGFEKGFAEALAEVLTEGRTERLAEVREEVLKRLCPWFEEWLGRALVAEEHKELRDRLARLGPGRLGAVAFDFSPEALEAWLSDPAAT